MKKIILIIGAPGSGKTSTSEKVAEKHTDMSHYSMGEIFRKEISNNTETGQNIERFLKKGVTIPINIALTAIKNVINNTPTQNVIIDGYPRDEEQLTRFNEFIVTQNELKLIGLVEIKVSELNAQKRILGRKGRADDNIKTFKERMLYYKKYRDTITENYKKQNKFYQINGDADFFQAIRQLNDLMINLFKK